MRARTTWAPFLALAVAVGCGGEAAAPPGGRSSADALVFIGGYGASALPLTPQGMNDSGSIAGTTATGAPALLDGGTLTALGTSPADGCIRYSQLRPTGTNGVVGVCDTSAGSHPIYWFFLSWAPSHMPLVVNGTAVTTATVAGATPGYSLVGTAAGGAFTWGAAYRWSGPGATSAVSMQPVALGSRTNWAYASDAAGSNDAGYAVGRVYTYADTYPVVWSPANGVTILQALGSYASYGTRPTAISNAGLVAGMSGTSSSTGWYAMLWNTSGALLSYVPLANLASVDAVSAQGRLVGRVYTVGGYRTWTWYAGSLTWIDPPAGYAYLVPVGVDSCGRIATRAYASGGTAAGFVYSKLFCDGGGVVLGP